MHSVHTSLSKINFCKIIVVAYTWEGGNYNFVC